MSIYGERRRGDKENENECVCVCACTYYAHAGVYLKHIIINISDTKFYVVGRESMNVL